MMKNLAVAASLVICAVALKNGALPNASNATDVVVSALTDDTLLDDQLGKLSFVSSIFPEATLVFGSARTGELALPVFQGQVVHAWSEAEPYISMQTNSREVLASAAGTVMCVAHGPDEELLVQILSNDGMVCVYGNLENVVVQPGDTVQEGNVLGTLLEEKPCVLEVRVDGVSVDPVGYFPNTL